MQNVKPEVQDLEYVETAYGRLWAVVGMCWVASPAGGCKLVVGGVAMLNLEPEFLARGLSLLQAGPMEHQY